MELKIEGLNVLGVMKVLDAFVEKVTDYRVERNPKNNKAEFTITLGGAEEFAIIPEENRIEVFDCKDFKEVILYGFQFQRFIIQ